MSDDKKIKKNKNKPINYKCCDELIKANKHLP